MKLGKIETCHHNILYLQIMSRNMKFCVYIDYEYT